MKNKIELKKTIILEILVLIISCVVFGIVNYVQYYTYTHNFNKKIESIISKIKETYPDINKEEIMEVLNNDIVKEKFPFENYGINLEKDSIIIENDKYFGKVIVINLCLLAITSIIIIIIFLKYNYSKDKKLNEITRYIEEINNKNYKLNIEDNKEDELSILKNEIYKTTVMLNEVAENSTNDKINLKNSISDISHQLKTPLTSINIMLDNILENPEMDEVTRNDFITDIKREIININFLVSSMLKLSKLDSNSVNFINKNEYIKTLIDESIKNVETLSDLKNVQIEVTKSSNFQINCDLRWQVEAITNILKNAIEHSKENSKIYINYNQNKMYSKIEIKDFGIGIDEEDLKHIFERFYKGKNSSSDSIGIGLALSKAIVEKNNGYITVESKLNEGTKFIIKYYSIKENI